MINKKKIYIVIFLLALSIAFIATSLHAKPSIEWSQDKLKIEQSQGQVNTYPVSIDINKNARSVVVRVVPELENWISISPVSIGDIEKGQTVNLDVIINTPIDTTIGVFDGVIQLKESVLGKPTKNLSKPLPVTLTIKEWDNNGLPPDPGAAGNQDLLGIDVDNDGVRDDVQNAIYRYYPNEADINKRLALVQFAKSVQLAFIGKDLNDDNQLNSALSKIISATNCITGTSSRPTQDLIFIENMIQNTDERASAYTYVNESAGGQFFGGEESTDLESFCER